MWNQINRIENLLSIFCDSSADILNITLSLPL